MIPLSIVTAWVTATGAPTDPQPADNNVVAGWVGAVFFVVLILGVALLCRSLVTRLRNVDKAAKAGLYDPSDPKPDRERRGLAARRPPSA